MQVMIYLLFHRVQINIMIKILVWLDPSSEFKTLFNKSSKLVPLVIPRKIIVVMNYTKTMVHRNVSLLKRFYCMNMNRVQEPNVWKQCGWTFLYNYPQVFWQIEPEYNLLRDNRKGIWSKIKTQFFTRYFIQSHWYDS